MPPPSRKLPLRGPRGRETVPVTKFAGRCPVRESKASSRGRPPRLAMRYLTTREHILSSMLSTTLILVLFAAAEEVPAPAPISAKEPLAKEFSAAAAARSLDVASLHWQATRKCGTCHTNFAYLMAR